MINMLWRRYMINMGRYISYIFKIIDSEILGIHSGINHYGDIYQLSILYSQILCIEDNL